MASQIKSKKRVASYGEVFTDEKQVSDMLDLVKDETERIDSKFLEPACGTGNFLVEILRRKLVAVKEESESVSDWERNTFRAIASIYGIELLRDNIKTCRERLLGIVQDAYERACGEVGELPLG